EPALVDQPPRTHALDLLENRAGAGVHLEPWVAGATPAQVFLKYPVHHGRIAAFQVEGGVQYVVVAVVKDGIVVSEAHVLRVNRTDIPLLAEYSAALEDLGDEHRAFPLGRWRKEVQVLPDRTTDRAWNPDVVLEP